MGNYFMAPAVNYLTKTLSGSLSDSATTITLNNTTNMLAPGYIVINRTNSSGTATPDNREVVYYTGISGSDLTGCTRGADGSTNRAHADGSLVETMLTTGAWNSLTTIVSTAIDSNGYLRAIASPVSIARAELTYIENTQMAVTSVASISRLVPKHLYASGASIELGHGSVNTKNITILDLANSKFINASQATFPTGGAVVLSGPTINFPGSWSALLMWSGETFSDQASTGNTFNLGLDGANLDVAAYGSVQQEVTVNNTIGEATSMSVFLPSLASGIHGFRVTGVSTAGIGAIRRASLIVIPFAR